MDKSKKKLGLYIRVSSDKQLEEGFSFQAQEDQLVQEANRLRQDYIVYRDGGMSGTNTDNREELKQLMTDVELGIISSVFVTKISRLARNSRDLQNMIYEFERNNVTFKAIKDGIDTSTAMGKVMIKLMGIFAEMERDTIMEQTRAGAERRAREGKIYGSAPIFGYDRVVDETSKKNTTKLIINTTESEVVNQIYNLYIGGYGYKAITNRLNKSGYRSKKGKLFAINTIKIILGNPLYAGYIRYGKYKDWEKKRRKGLAKDYILVEGNHEAIISKEEWEKVQVKMSKNQRKHLPTGKYILAGVLTCPECGSKMVGSKSRYKTKRGMVENLYYTCSQFHNKGITACRSNGVRVDLIDPIAIKKISKKLNSKQMIDTLYEYINTLYIDEKSFEGKKRLLEIEIEKQDKRKNDLRSLYTEGVITIEELKEDIEKLKQKTLEYEQLLTELDEDENRDYPSASAISKENVEEFLNEISDVLLTENKDERLKAKELIRELIDSISIIDKTKVSLDIEMKYSELAKHLIPEEGASSGS